MKPIRAPIAAASLWLASAAAQAVVALPSLNIDPAGTPCRGFPPAA